MHFPDVHRNSSSEHEDTITTRAVRKQNTVTRVTVVSLAPYILKCNCHNSDAQSIDLCAVLKQSVPLPDSATNIHLMSSEWRENSAFMKHDCDWGRRSDQGCNDVECRAENILIKSIKYSLHLINCISLTL